MNLLSLIARNRMSAATEQRRYATQTSERRTRGDLLDTLNDAVDQTVTAIRARRVAETERDCALQIVRELSEEREAYRRVVDHLRAAWQPPHPDEQHYQDLAAMDAWIAAERQTVAADEAWIRDHRDRVERTLQKARNRIR